MPEYVKSHCYYSEEKKIKYPWCLYDIHDGNKQLMPPWLIISALELQYTNDGLKNTDSDSHGFIRIVLYVPKVPISPFCGVGLW